VTQEAATTPAPPAVGIAGLPPGLTQVEAERRAAQGLANVEPGDQRTDGDVIRANTLTFFNFILGGLILSLFAVGIAELDTSYFKDGVFVGVVVAANILVATFQELRATHTLRELVALTAPRATVVRDGIESPILAEHVSRHLIHPHGDQVGGRHRRRQTRRCRRTFNGESDSVPAARERFRQLLTAGDPTTSRRNAPAYAQRLTADARQLVKRRTPLQLRFNRILRVLLILTFLLAAALMISYNVEHRGLGESLKATTATVSTVVPEGLLLAMTVAFTIGAVRVSRAGAVVQDVPAVEALNYVDVICLDKTGTITANRLTLDASHWVAGSEADAPWLAAYAVSTSTDSKTAGALADALVPPNGATPMAGSPNPSGDGGPG
jgi:cation-transporting ATPase E